MIRQLILPFFLLVVQVASGQGKIHAHNDYNQAHPFYDAIAVQAFSIEADIFLQGDSLYVAHSVKEIKPGNTLERLYLKPSQKFFETPDFYSFQLMIDVKSNWETTYPVLIKLLNRYKKMLTPGIKRVGIVISGNRPDDIAFRKYPDIITFDGLPARDYSAPDLRKVFMISDDFAKYTNWKGTGKIAEEDRQKLLKVIGEARQNRKFIRFWNTPDTEECWALLMNLGAYNINTDRLKECSDFLKSLNKN